MNQFYSVYDSPVGQLLLTCDGEHLTGLSRLTQANGSLIESKNLVVLSLVKTWLDDYFKGNKPSVANLPLVLQGSCFQQRVWQILQQIPYGKLMTYGEIAQQIMCQTGQAHLSAQAVGGAVGRNPISIIVPCHRVIGVNGNLTGYTGGLDMKIKLLEIENVDMQHLFMPKK